MSSRINQSTRSPRARRFMRGVGLVEVMIALVVLAIGFLALGQLQTASVRSAAEARTRTAATNLAVDKLDELRSFYSRLSDADGNGTPDLILDTDGNGIPDAVGPSFDLIAAGNDTPSEVGTGTTGFNFTRNWQVTPCTISQAGVVACGGTLTMANADFARVSVRVRWNAADGTTATQEVVIEDLVSSTTPLDAAVALSQPATSRESPKVYIQPARIQSTIPIAIGDDTASAASDPQPTIIRDNIVRTQFEVLTFSGSGNDLLAERAFDYTVVGCDCTMDGVVSGKKSFEPTVWNGLGFTRPREVTNGVEHPAPDVTGNVSRVTATAILRNNDPDLVKDLCTSCCRDHHDTLVTSTPKLNPARPSSEYLLNGNHNHYLPVLSAGNYTFQLANNAGDQYYETCRFIRRDGIYRLTLDANLVDLQIFPDRLLDEEAERLDYSEYAKQYIEAYVNAAADSTNGYPNLSQSTLDQIRATALAAIPTANQGVLARLDPTAAFALNSPGLQSVSRGIYVDYMTPEVLTGVRCKINNTPDLPECAPFRGQTKLEIVPFFAVGMTRLNNWAPADNNVATMPLRDSRDPFSRGWAVPVRNGQTFVESRSPISNIGLTNPIPGSPLEQGAVLTDSIPVEVGGTAPPIDPPRTVRFTVSVDRNTLLDNSGVVVLSGIGGTCTQTGGRSGGTDWSCTLSSAGVGGVTFASYTGTECVRRERGSCVQEAPVRNLVCLSPLAATLTSNPNGTNAYLDTTAATFDGSQANDQLYAADVIPASAGPCPGSDAPPGVLSTTPANGAVDVSPITTTSIAVTFNEAVDVEAGAVSLICANANGTTGNLVYGGSSPAQTNVTSMTVALQPATSLLILPGGATCTLTVTGALVTDVDTNDPPDVMPSNHVSTFTTAALSGDQPPSVSGTVPSDGAGSVLNNVALRINFSEPVNAAAGSVQLTCGGSNLITGGTTGTGVTSLSPTYSGTLPNGQQCTIRVLASLITDSDTDDPPDNMSSDYVGTFTVASLNQAPYVTSFTKTGGGRRNPVFTVVFNEPVTLTTTGLATITCGASTITNFTVAVPSSTTATITLGNNALPNNGTCSARINRANVVDQASPPLPMTTSYCIDYATANPGTVSNFRTCAP